MEDDAAMQAECVVRALDTYLVWIEANDREQIAAARKRLVDTFAATIRMSEPRKNDLTRALSSLSSPL